MEQMNSMDKISKGFWSDENRSINSIRLFNFELNSISFQWNWGSLRDWPLLKLFSNNFTFVRIQLIVNDEWTFQFMFKIVQIATKSIIDVLLLLVVMLLVDDEFNLSQLIMQILIWIVNSSLLSITAGGFDYYTESIWGFLCRIDVEILIDEIHVIIMESWINVRIHRKFTIL